MPIVTATGKHRRKVRFPSSNNQPVVSTSSLSKIPDKDRVKISNNLQRNTTTTATGRSASGRIIMASATTAPASEARAGIPSLFTQPPLIQDPVLTETTDLQNETVQVCLPFLKGLESSQKGPFNEHGVPALQRDQHIQYLCDALEEYPAGFVVLDASRPWMTLWALSGLSLLGEDVTRYRER